jgi:hypothetical protein
MIHLKIIPDTKIDNTQVETLSRSLASYKNLISRWNKEKKRFDKHPYLSFETILKKEGSFFLLTVKKESEKIARKAIESTFPRATIEAIEDPLKKAPIRMSELNYHNHYFLSLRVDKRSNSLLSAILDTTLMLSADEEIYLQNLAIPAGNDWYIPALEAYKKFKKGELPRKIRLDKAYIGKTALLLSTKAVVGAVNSLVSLTGGKLEDPIDLDKAERSHILKDGYLRSETIHKARGEAYDVSIRVGIVCKSQDRARDLTRMISTAYRSLDGDNHLVDKKINEERGFKLMKERKADIKIQKDYMSTLEFSRLLLMPTNSLQEKFKIENVSSLVNPLPDRLLKGGLWLGSHIIKGKEEKIYFPLKDWDELCLPRIVIGGMGSGKTKGYGANLMYQAVLNGFGALCIDPAKGEIYQELASKLSSDQLIRINIGETPISLDWREAKHSKKAKGRLANTILSFFANSSDEAGAQTSRYIRASVMAMRGEKLSEILSILEDDKTREEAIMRLEEGSIHHTTLRDLNDHSPGRRRQILEPILNRFDMILGDEFLAECFNADEGIDLVNLMSQKKAIVIDVPKSIVGSEGVEIIGSLLSTKIDLAMTLRKEEDQFPFFIVADEPHQYSKSAKVWKSASVESRKWRVGYVWLFHEWKQIDQDLRDIIKSALPHYHLYSSSSKTYRDLIQEIAPYTVEEALKTPRHYAINIIRSGGDYVKPFIAKMSLPPSMQKEEGGK